MTNHIKKSHDKPLLLCHLVYPVKYRRDVLSKQHEGTLETICLGTTLRYEIYYANEAVAANYVKNQGLYYQQLHHDTPILFEGMV